MTAIGASLRQVGAFVWSEVAMVLFAGALLAALLGWLLAQMLVAMLTHVFDPPPDHLALPWGFLGLLYGVAVLAGIGGSLSPAGRSPACPSAESCGSAEAPADT